jgi:hypothetical protein
MKNMFECPECKTRVPLWNAFFLTNFTKIKCRRCGALLIPNRQTMEKIGARGVAVALPFLLVFYRIFGFMGVIMGVLVGYFIASIIAMKITKFKVS